MHVRTAGPAHPLTHRTGCIVTDGLFTYRAESARALVESFSGGSNKAIEYYVEPEQNIAVARNRAIAQAEGELVALTDDDEFPGRDGWSSYTVLCRLTMRRWR